MAEKKEWFRKHRAALGALILTVVLAAAVFSGKLQSGRALVAFCFCWMLALHSEDVNDHKQEVMVIFDEMAKAGIDWRTGKKAACAEDVEAAARTGAQLAREVQAEEAVRKGSV